MVPYTVQLIVDVAGLNFSAPALYIIPPAGYAPDSIAQRNFACHFSWSFISMAANALAIRINISFTDASWLLTCLSFKRYFYPKYRAMLAVIAECYLS